MKPVIIIGAGIAGLAAADRFGNGTRIFEQRDRVGGLVRTFSKDGFSYDYGPHVLYFRDPKIYNWLINKVRGRLDKHQRRAHIQIAGQKVDYPVQEGFLRSEELKIRYLPGLLDAQGGNGGEFSIVARGLFGNCLAEDFFVPYNQKLWKYPLGEMEPGWASRFLPSYPKSDLDLIARGVRLPRGTNAEFYYPRQHGIGDITSSLSECINGELFLSTTISAINSREKWVETSDNTRFSYSYLISTIPLDRLTRCVIDLPSSQKNMAQELRSVGLIIVHLSHGCPAAEDSHWIYYPDRDFVFHRVSIPENFSGTMVPDGRGSILAEVTFLPFEKPDLKSLLNRVKHDAVKAGLIKDINDILDHEVRINPCAYVFPTAVGERARKRLRSILEKQGILLAGRYAMWEYGNIESAIKQGFAAAERIKGAG